MINQDFTDIVWVTTGFLGDLILATAGFELAARHFPKVRQHVITTPLGVAALAGSKALAQRIVFDKRGRSTWHAIRATLKDLEQVCPRGTRPLVLQVHRSFRTSLLTRLSGLPTLTYIESSWSSHAVRRVSRIATLHEAARIGLLLEPLGIPRAEIIKARPALQALPLDETVPWQAHLARWHQAGRRIIGIAPGSVWGTKRWTKEGFGEVVRLILQKTQDAVLLLGSGTEKALCTEIVRDLGERGVDLNSDRFYDASGSTSLDDLRRIYPVMNALLSNDSSPLHYASAFDTPTVALFGATVPEMGFGPLASRSRTLGVTLDCRPCSDHGPQICPRGHFRCMREISPTEVCAALESVM